MKQTESAKLTWRAASNARRASSAGRRAISFAPPDYGLAFIDRGHAAIDVSAPALQLRRDHEAEELRQGGLTDATAVQLQSDELSEPRTKEARTRESGTSLPDSLKSGLERLGGFDLSGVRVHYNSAKPAEFDALAYTRGREIHVGPGQERHLPHEGWHVVQQMQGRVKQTTRSNGVGIDDRADLEREADVMGARAFAQKSRALSGSVESPAARAESPTAAPASRVAAIQLKPRDIDTTTRINLVDGEVQEPEGERERVSVAFPINKMLTATWAIPTGDLKGGHLYKREFGGTDDYSNVVPWHADIEADYTERFEDVYSAGWKAKGKGKGVSRGAETWILTVQAAFTETSRAEIEQYLPPASPAPEGKEDPAQRERFIDVIRWSIDTIPASAKASIEKEGEPSTKIPWTADPPKDKTNIRVNDDKQKMQSNYDFAHSKGDYEGPIDADTWFDRVEEKLMDGASH